MGRARSRDVPPAVPRPLPHPLLPLRLRPTAAALLAACAGVTLVLGILFAGQTHAGRLDASVDGWIRSGLAHDQALLRLLAWLGDPRPVTLMTAALVLACAVTRRWRGCVLAAVAVPAASALTEFVFKPLTDRTLNGWLSYPSGHATVMFALATVSWMLLANPAGQRRPGAVRLMVASGAFLLAAAVSVAMVGLGFHYFTDIAGGAAVGAGTVLACAFVVEWAAASRRRHPREQAGRLRLDR
jgi:membrane-associated phospholipid phosphatase